MGPNRAVLAATAPQSHNPRYRKRKESFDQFWNYEREAWARRFFENWKSALKWQRLKPFKKFVKLIDRHWDSIVAHCDPRNKVPLGFVEGFNNNFVSYVRQQRQFMKRFGPQGIPKVAIQ